MGVIRQWVSIGHMTIDEMPIETIIGHGVGPVVKFLQQSEVKSFRIVVDVQPDYDQFATQFQFDVVVPDEIATLWELSKKHG